MNRSLIKFQSPWLTHQHSFSIYLKWSIENFSHLFSLFHSTNVVPKSSSSATTLTSLTVFQSMRNVYFVYAYISLGIRYYIAVYKRAELDPELALEQERTVPPQTKYAEFS